MKIGRLVPKFLSNTDTPTQTHIRPCQFLFLQWKVFSRVLVTIDGVWIGNWIYWSLTSRVTLLPILTLQITPH
jgi:hypothetical protein